MAVDDREPLDLKKLFEAATAQHAKDQATRYTQWLRDLLNSRNNLRVRMESLTRDLGKVADELGKLDETVARVQNGDWSDIPLLDVNTKGG